VGWYDGFRPYVPVAQRRARAAKEIASRIKKGQSVCPVRIEGRQITTTFWGRAWCENLEGYSDYANRLPRGRTYVRNGSVVDLQVEKGRIKALVSGSALYTIEIDIAELPKPHWLGLKQQCAGRIGSLVELLQGKLSKAVMEQVTDRNRGLFPKPNEITMRCSCPDWAGLCKHLAAVMYGVGHRLDSSPETLFVLRGVDHAELIEQAISAAPARSGRSPQVIPTNELGAIFDIEIDAARAAKPRAMKRDKPAAKKAATKARTVKKAKAAAVPRTAVRRQTNSKKPVVAPKG
jgi:uncharacterized Zn finger protein